MGFLYLINSGVTDKYKIGISKKPPKRKKSLQTGNPEELKIVQTYESKRYQEIETVLLRLFKAKKYDQENYKMIGGEWFILNNEDVSSFTEICRKIEMGLTVISKNIDEFF